MHFFFHFQNKCQCQDALNSSYALIYQIISKWKIIYPLVWDLWSLGTRWYNCTYLCDGEVEIWIWSTCLRSVIVGDKVVLYMFEDVEFLKTLWSTPLRWRPTQNLAFDLEGSVSLDDDGDILYRTREGRLSHSDSNPEAPSGEIRKCVAFYISFKAYTEIVRSFLGQIQGGSDW